MLPETRPPTDPDLPAPDEALRRWGGHLLKTGLVLLGAYFTWRLLSDIDWSDLSARVGQASWPLLALGTALLLGRYLLWDWRFRLAARYAVPRPPRAGFGFFVLMASAALNLITPSARLIGGLMRARYFSHSMSRSFGLLYGVVLYDQVAHHVVMSVCTGLSLVALALALGRTGLALGVLAALLAAAVALGVWSRRGGSFEANPLVRLLARRAERAEGRAQRFYAHGHEAVGIFLRLLAPARLHGQAAVLGLGFFLLNIAAQWLVFLALGEPMSLLVVLAGVSLGNAAGMLTGTPGGLGTTEAAMVAFFTAMGMDPVHATAGSLLFRGLHYASILAVGLPALAALEFRMSRDKRQTDEA